MSEVTINVRPNGPFRVEGPIKLIDAGWPPVGPHREAGHLALPLRGFHQKAILRWHAQQRSAFRPPKPRLQPSNWPSLLWRLSSRARLADHRDYHLPRARSVKLQQDQPLPVCPAPACPRQTARSPRFPPAPTECDPACAPGYAGADSSASAPSPQTHPGNPDPFPDPDPLSSPRPSCAIHAAAPRRSRLRSRPSNDATLSVHIHHFSLTSAS